jgi:hypothetical protein
MTVMQKRYWTGAEFANTESNMKNVKMRFVAQTQKRQGVRRPFERSENYVPPSWPSILYLRQSSAQ